MTGDLPLTPDDVAEIVAILEGSGYERVEVRTTRFALKIRRGEEGWTQEWNWGEPAIEAPVAAADSAAPIAGTADDGSIAVRAPLPGTFYRAPQPGAPPFVEVGDKVAADSVVAIIETMKLMTPVHAGTDGTVEAILRDNAELVDAGDALFRIAH